MKGGSQLCLDDNLQLHAHLWVIIIDKALERIFYYFFRFLWESSTIRNTPCDICYPNGDARIEFSIGIFHFYD